METDEIHQEDLLTHYLFYGGAIGDVAINYTLLLASTMVSFRVNIGHSDSG